MAVQQRVIDLEFLQEKMSTRPSTLPSYNTNWFNLYAEYIMQNVRLGEAQAGIKILGEISITSDMQMTPPLWQKEKKY